ncbi:MAG: Cobyrinic acid ac-diamide synthase [Chloroflexi bacterium]|nr:Cobyrinic acid ac-diamide synthase [Chloroflexota bacterium]
MTRTVAVANQKGGVGKTTTAVSLAAHLGAAGRVLLVDMDPQANATSSLGLHVADGTPSVYEVLIGRAAMESVLIRSGEPGLTVAPASQALAGAQVDLVDTADGDLRLRNALQPVLGLFDLVIIDCPPAVGVLTVNALAAADAVLVPVQCEYLALEGLGQIMQLVEAMRCGLNPRLDLLGVLPTMFDSRTNLSTQVVDEIRHYFPNETFESVVPRSVRLSEAPSFGKSIVAYDAHSRAAEAYAQVAQEIIARGYWR